MIKQFKYLLRKPMGGSMDYWFPVTRSNIGEGIEKEAKK
jgi:hypothetical protein